MSEAGVFISSNEVVLMYQDKMIKTERKSSDLNKFSSLIMHALEKGLDDFQMNELLESLKLLPDNIFTFSIAGTKGRDRNYYYYIIHSKKERLRVKIRNNLQKIFSLPKKRKELDENQIAKEIAKSYITEILESAIEKGLTRNEQVIFRELAYFLYYTNFELQEKRSEDSEKVHLTLYSY